MAEVSKDSVRVIARFRPPNAHQAKTKGDRSDDNFLLEFPNPASVVIRVPNGPEPRPYSFDQVFDSSVSQEGFYKEVIETTVNDVLQGYNGTIFAYGQTGSGKTHTMMGPKGPDMTLAGVIPRAVHGIFDALCKLEDVKEITIGCSFLEIYREQIRDLLNPAAQQLRVREIRGETTVQNLTFRSVGSAEELLDHVRSGDKFRSVAATNMNETSSRSHSVLIITVQQKFEDGSEKVGRLNLADLAGSERVGDTGASGQTLEEAKKINQSLSSLGNCINALTDSKRSHIPYRDSLLTHILKDSLGGNTKTTLIVCCSSDSYNAPETVSTLKFGIRAKSVKNKVKINRIRSVAELEAIISHIRNELNLLTKHNTLLRTLLVEMYIDGHITAENNPLLDTSLPTLNESAKQLVEYVIEALRTGVRNIPVPADTAINATLKGPEDVDDESEEKADSSAVNARNAATSADDSISSSAASAASAVAAVSRDSTSSSSSSTPESTDSQSNPNDALLNEISTVLALSGNAISKDEISKLLNESKSIHYNEGFVAGLEGGTKKGISIGKKEAIEEFKKTLEETQKKFKAVLTSRNTETRILIEAKDNALVAKNEELFIKTNELSAAHMEIENMKSEFAAFEAFVDETQKASLNDLTQQEARYQSLAKSHAEVSAIRARLEVELMNSNALIAQAEASLSQLANDNQTEQSMLDVRVAAAEQATQSLTSELVMNKTLVGELEMMLEKASTDNDSNLAKLNEANNVRKTLEKQLSDYKTQIQKLHSQIQEQESVMELMSAENTNNMNDQVKKYKNSLDQVNQENLVLAQRLQDFTTQLSRMETDTIAFDYKLKVMKIDYDLAVSEIRAFQENHFQCMKQGTFSKLSMERAPMPQTLEDCQALIAKLQDEKDQVTKSTLAMNSHWTQYLNSSVLLNTKKGPTIVKTISLTKK